MPSLSSSCAMNTTASNTFGSFVRKTLVIAEFEVRKLRHDYTELLTRAIQPALWLLLFGEVLNHAGIMATGNFP